MIPATTPTFIFTFEESSPLKVTDDFQVEFSQGKVYILKTTNDLVVDREDGSITYTMSQEESARFHPGIMLMQIFGAIQNEKGVVINMWKTNIIRRPVEETISYRQFGEGIIDPNQPISTSEQVNVTSVVGITEEEVNNILNEKEGSDNG